MDEKYNEHKFTFTRVKPIKTEYRTFKIIKDGVDWVATLGFLFK